MDLDLTPNPSPGPVVTTDIKYQLIVETDSYAGNFERDLTAFATGVVGDCQVGEEAAVDFIDAAAAMGYDIDVENPDGGSPFSNLLDQVIDCDGCYRPCEMSLNANSEYNSVTMFLYRHPSARDAAFIAQRIRAFPEWFRHWYKRVPPVIISIRLQKQVVTTSYEFLEEF